MKCSVCEGLGLKSQVYPPSAWFSTAMFSQDFYDEDGVRHHHDPNRMGGPLRCSNGHQGHQSLAHLCPAPECSWNEGRTDEVRWDEPESAPA